VNNPMRALAKQQTWQDTGGMGLHGGPWTGPSDALGRAKAAYNSWNSAS